MKCISLLILCNIVFSTQCMEEREFIGSLVNDMGILLQGPIIPDTSRDTISLSLDGKEIQARNSVCTKMGRLITLVSKNIETDRITVLADFYRDGIVHIGGVDEAVKFRLLENIKIFENRENAHEGQLINYFDIDFVI